MNRSLSRNPQLDKNVPFSVIGIPIEEVIVSYIVY